MTKTKSVNENNKIVLMNIKFQNRGLWKQVAMLYQLKYVIYFCTWYKAKWRKFWFTPLKLMPFIAVEFMLWAQSGPPFAVHGWPLRADLVAQGHTLEVCNVLQCSVKQIFVCIHNCVTVQIYAIWEIKFKLFTDSCSASALPWNYLGEDN